MGIVQRAIEFIQDTKSYLDGLDAGEAWVENGGGPVNDAILQIIHSSRDIETPSWVAFNRGFVEEAGYQESEEDE